PSVRQATDSVGLTGPQGILPHLTGDFAVEAELDRSFFPAGAVMIGTDDANRMRSFITGILGLAGQGQASRPTTTTYRGVTIQSAPAGSAVGSLHLKTDKNLTPLRAFILTSDSSADGMVERFVVILQ